MEMRLLNARHFASGTRGVDTLIFSEPIFTVEHEWRCCDSLRHCCPVILQLDTLVRCYPTITAGPSDICQTSRLFCVTNRSGFHVFGTRGLRLGSNAHQPSFHLSSANRRPVAILPSARSDRYRPAKPAAAPLRYECT